MAKLEQEAHRLAAKALEQQERGLTELRTRTGVLLTTASLAASFLGGQVLAREASSVWVVLGLIASGVSIALCVYVLMPKAGLIFVLDGPEAYEALYEIRYNQEEVDRRLTYWLQSFRQSNHLTVKRLTNAFELAGLALLTEIAFLAVGLALA